MMLPYILVEPSLVLELRTGGTHGTSVLFAIIDVYDTGPPIA